MKVNIRAIFQLASQRYVTINSDDISI